MGSPGRRPRCSRRSGWQVLTDLHGEIIVKEAIDQTKFSFNYDSQEYAYQEIQQLLNEAIVLLQRTDGAVDQSYMARTDKIYGGDRTKWLKLAYGMLALNLNHYSNKSTYKPADVVAAVNKSFTSNADDPLLTYPNTQNDDINFWGRTRNNISGYRQTQFVVGLMNGTVFGGAVDPRMSRMLSPAPDGVYRGLDINVVGFGALTTSQQPNNFHGYSGTGGVGLPGRFLFDDKAKMPIMTYAQLQFIKAEALYKLGDMAGALQAYTTGISTHIDWVNARNADNSQSPTQITAAEKAAFLANTNIVPATRGRPDADAHHVAEVHRAVGVGTQRDLDGSPALPLHRPRSERCAAGVPRIHPAREPVSGQRRQGRAAHTAAVQLGVCVEQGGPRRHRRTGTGLPHEAALDHSTVTQR